MPFNQKIRPTYANTALKILYEGQSRGNVGQMKYRSQINPVIKYVQTKLSSKRLRAVNWYLMTFFSKPAMQSFKLSDFHFQRNIIWFTMFSLKKEKRKNAWCNQHGYQTDKQKYWGWTNHNEIKGTGLVSGKSLFWWCHDL